MLSPYLCLFFFYINLFILFIYFWLHWVFVAGCGLSLVAESGGYCSLRCAGFSLWWLLFLQSTGSRHGFQQLWLVGSRAQAQQLWRTRFVVQQLWHVGSSLTRDRTRVPCIGRWILSHCTTRKAQICVFSFPKRDIFSNLAFLTQNGSSHHPLPLPLL